MLTQEYLKLVINYDPETGIFLRLARPLSHYKSLNSCNLTNSRIAGTIAGWISKKGYRRIRIDGITYGAHQLAWLYVYGEWPESDVDHVNNDGPKHDNRICNLRLATRSQNAANTGKKSTNKSGYKGVSWHKATCKWRAQIMINGKKTHLGLFDSAEDAHKAYVEKIKEIHGEFARTK